MEEKTKNLIIIIALIYMIIAILIYLGTSITGYVIYVQTNYSLELIPENFIYNSSLILIENNKISLYPNIITENITKIINQNFYITSAKRDGTDFTQEVIALDNTTVNINRNKKFNIIFDNDLNNENIIRLYIEITGEATAETAYLCNYDEDCEFNESYGSIFIDKGDWYNITIQNLNVQTDKFNLALLKQEKPNVDILKINYIDAIKTETLTYTNTIIQYPQEAELESKEINLNGTIQAILIEENQNTGNTTVFYSTDQGLNWNLLSNEIINSNNSNVKLKISLSSNQNLTPEINNMNLIYLESTEETNSTTNQTQQNTTIETPAPSGGSSSGGGGGGGGGGSSRKEPEQATAETPTSTEERTYEPPIAQPSQPKELIIIGETEVPKPKTNTPFLVGLTARIVYSGKNMVNFLLNNWGWLLFIIALLIVYIYLYFKRKKDKKQQQSKKKIKNSHLKLK